MPEIKHQFKGGKMNKDLDERLIPNGEYKDAMNIQVATSEGSDVGTIQNILGNTSGCATSYIQDESFTVGSISDEKNDTLYWLVSGPNNMETELFAGETSSAKDMIVSYNQENGCRPIFVDKYRFCVGLENLGSVGNSILMPQDSFYDQITAGMTATGYGNGNNLFGPTLVSGIGSVNTFPVDYNSDFTSSSTSSNYPNIVISDGDNTKMYQRGFYDDTTGKYTNIHYDASVDTAFAPFTQSNLPPDGASQFWIPQVMIPAQHGIMPGDLISQVFPQYYHSFQGGQENGINGSYDITIYNIVLGNIVDQNSNNNLAWIITVGEPGGQYDGGINRCWNCWSDSDGNKYGCNWYTGIAQKVASITAGFQNAEAFPFIELEANITTSLQNVTTVNTSTNVINLTASSGWLDEIYNTLYDASGILTGAQISINNNIGAGFNFPPNSCIDPSSVDPPSNGVYDSQFVIMDCNTEIPLLDGDITIDTTGRPLHFQILGNALDAVILNENVDFSNVDTICFESERILNFDKDRLINSVDIIDDMLFWTDNKYEPKKINITRSVQGTHVLGETHTAVINQDAGYDLIGNYNPIREEHITVIKKSPKNALDLELIDGRDDSLSYSGITRVGLDASTSSIISSSSTSVIYDFSTITVGDNVSFSIDAALNSSNPMDFEWEEGGYLLLKEFNAGTSINVPLVNWTIRGLIVSSPLNNFDASGGIVRVEIQVVALNGIPADPDPNNNGGSLEYVVDYEDTDPRIFKDKFPRFSYRYKYEDGEYSTFAPWSNVAFLPTSFSYLPKRGFNEGMLNNLKYIKLKGFQPAISYSPIGQDVVEVDILYKEDSSPSVYLVQTISPIDILPVGSSSLPWFLNEYIVESEAIKSTLPSNQLLRPWDNVPKKALAQSISGSRVIYANYEQNYDLKVNNNNYKPDFKNAISSWAAPINGGPEKSIKSLRDYKLGVVFTDNYGRETPVLISENGGFKVKKTDSINANRLKVGLKGSVPPEMTYYKFYLKETSSEYYNLAMDRWYAAEDGNLWLAFPSLDRNKVDLETSLYFKKGDDGDKNVIENSTTYKVLAIENEAPEFIKTRKIRIGTVSHFSSSNEVFGGGTTDPLDQSPTVGGVSFKMNFGAGFNGTSLSRMEDITEDIYIQFASSTDRSRQYKISEITSDRDETSQASSNIPASYFVTFDTVIKDDINFIFDNAAAPSLIVDGVKVVFTKSVIENKPKFDGRFFVKIENDGKIKTQITDDSIGTNYIEIASKKVYVLDADNSLASKSEAAVVTPTRNYVTTDYQSAIALGNSSQQTENPSGQNWNHLAARNAYFLKGRDNATQTSQTNLVNFNPSVQNVYAGTSEFFATYHINNLFYPDNKHPNVGTASAFVKSTEKKFNGFNGTYDYQDVAGVWFIDRSTKKYKLNTADGDDNELTWTNTTNMNGFATPQCQYASDCGYTGVTGNVGNGIINDAVTNSSDIDLGFGGFGGLNGWDYDAGDQSTCTTGSFSFADNSKLDYFSVGSSNTNWNDNITTKFVDALSPGFTFRWREDPTETIYTISGQTSYQKNLRFGRFDDSHCGSGNLLIGAQSSYTKTFSLKVTPSMSDWDPAGNIGTPMVKGLSLGEGIPVDPKPRVSAVSNGSTVLTFISTEDISNVKVGMSVGVNANFDKLAKVISVDTLTNEITIDIAVSAAINANTALDFRFSIRVVEEYMYNAPSGNNLTEPQENYIIVDSIFTECKRGNNLKPTYSLHKGMMIDQYNFTASDSVGAIDHAIKSIEEYGVDATTGAKRWKLTIAGYYANINSYTQGWITDAWVAGDRITFQQVPMNGISNFTESNSDMCQTNSPLNVSGSEILGAIVAVGYDMMIMEAVDEYSDGGNLPENPFVWETEPKENTPLDIYYEISENNPTKLNSQTINVAIPIASKVISSSGEGGTWNDVSVIFNSYPSGQEIRISENVWVGPGPAPDGTPPIVVGSVLKITKPNGLVFGIEVESWTPNAITPSIANRFKFQKNLHNSNHSLNWHNCYSFGNGVESNRIKDTFNSPFINNGVKVSTTIGDNYKKEHRKNGLIYSGLYNSTSGVNNLNQFIAAEKITKDINPVYGSIQKLHSRSTADGDLIALCEDRVLKILAEKDAVFNADGNAELVATNKVLGQAMPFSGEYGISKNPESFASESYRLYFTDKTRGTVVRLSKDGLTPISSHGMKDWFKDNLKLNDVLVGSYDDKKEEYNISLLETTEDVSKTVSFREDSKGWVSFRSFVTKNAISCGGEYYTFKNAKLWLHHVEQFDPVTQIEVNRNTFYGIHNSNHYSTFTAVLNDVPSSVKSFKTLNYEGSQARVLENIDNATGLTYTDGEYYNLTGVEGWFVDSPTSAIPAAETNLEKGGVNEFIEKEGKWFAYFTGVNNTIHADGYVIEEFRSSDFSTQGLGTLVSLNGVVASGCTDVTAFNYDASANSDDGSCIDPVYGCTDPTALNYSALANTDDGSCVISGCTNPASFNYNANANTDDGSCIAIVSGCTSLSSVNYNSLANVDDGSCIAFSYGCTDFSAFNYDANVNTDDGSCVAIVSGCTDLTATNFNATANTDDGSCYYLVNGCTDPLAFNYDALANTDDGSCIAVVLGCNDVNADNYNTTATVDDGSCVIPGCTDGFAQNYNVAATYDDGSCVANVISGCTDPLATNYNALANYDSGGCVILGCIDPLANNYDTNATYDDGSCAYALLGCIDPTATNFDAAATTDDGSCLYLVPGCTDSQANNFDPLATTDDNSCTYPSSLLIGDYYQGGIIFYLDGNGGGFVAALQDQAAAPWGCMGSAIPGAAGASLGSGAQNTADIIAGCAEPGIPARLSDSYSVTDPSTGYYDDWFLPASSTAAEMHNAIGLGVGLSVGSYPNFTYPVNTAGVSTFNIGNFTAGTRSWTSTESNSPGAGQAQLARTVNQDTGTVTFLPKSSAFSSRPIRSF